MSKMDEAAVRHYRDALLLEKCSKLDNAGQLLGLAAECALKHFARGFAKGEIEGHLPSLKRTIRQILEGRRASGPLLQFVKSAAFQDWSISDRYSATGHVSATQLSSWKQDVQKSLSIARLRT